MGYLNPKVCDNFHAKICLRFIANSFLRWPLCSEGAPERHVAVTNLANIRWALSQKRPVPR